ncbi:radical SAM family heme chaperone HemW [Ruminococcus flavefaciens]|uniref:Heme chaperone HemW n=1 Tax=Ruminococcus flavefaciens TaxID=1265 RepID=A0A1K1MCB2_RUMFL|nr:radical SAM family heme chaperone HemW [Ruminococcus flavefaciens]SFW20772.1 oxygen-independent coproporphyrinogen-3 oxidase [Ruminococcus flavefaciens]
MSRLGIYIHVPFCGRKCAYCDFYSVNWSKSAAVDYTAAVLRNIRHYGDKARTVDTVYFGGGTPSLLTAEQISSIISEIRSCFALEESAEITLEANPCTLSAEKLAELRKIGINRLSIGVQSMIDRELKILGRMHTAERAEQAVLEAARAGFDNISCDLMIALPDQKPEDMRFSIDRLAALPIQHISAYILKAENGTPFDCAEIRDRLPDEDSTAELYLAMVELLEKQGFMQYEVSNFAKEGFESRHNTRYWKCLDYLGIGPAAHSCYEGKRFAVERDLSAFIAADVQQVTVTDESPCGFEEFAMLRLRLKEGLILDDVPEHRAELLKKLPPLLKEGYAETDGERIWLTPKGFLMSNSVIEYLVF